MFSMGPWELAIILVVALVIVGPEKLPELARMVGRAMRDLKKYASDVRGELEKDLPMSDIKRDLDVFSKETPSYDYTYGDESDTSEGDTYPYEGDESYEGYEDESGEDVEQEAGEEDEVKDPSDTEGRLDVEEEEEYPD
jgi:Tat protein translocase TatB subunit